MRNSAKLAVLVAVGASAASLALSGCSSSDDSSSGFGGSGNSSGTTSHAGTTSGGTTAQGGTATGVSGGGATGLAGTSAGGATAGTGGASTGGGGAAAGGTGGASTAGTGGASGGTGGASDAIVATCGTQVYTPIATPGAACATTVVPTASLIAAFESTAAVAPGWGVYPNVDAMTGFTPTTATPTAGGANGTAGALAFTVASLPQGIKIQVGFGTQCQDVRTFSGLSFWAKGTIDAATAPFAVDANTLVLLLGSETSAQGGCTAGTCAPGAPDRRVTITADWKEYRIPFGCFGDGKVFDGYYTNILFNAFGTNSNFAIDQVGYYK